MTKQARAKLLADMAKQIKVRKILAYAAYNAERHLEKGLITRREYKQIQRESMNVTARLGPPAPPPHCPPHKGWAPRRRRLAR